MLGRAWHRDQELEQSPITTPSRRWGAKWCRAGCGFSGPLRCSRTATLAALSPSQPVRFPRRELHRTMTWTRACHVLRETPASGHRLHSAEDCRSGEHATARCRGLNDCREVVAGAPMGCCRLEVLISMVSDVPSSTQCSWGTESSPHMRRCHVGGRCSVARLGSAIAWTNGR